MPKMPITNPNDIPTRDWVAGSDSAKALGHRIRVARRALGLSARELAAMAGCSHVTIYHAEAGRSVPGPELLWRIAMATGQTVESLLGIASTDPGPADPPAPAWEHAISALAELMGYPASSVAGDKRPDEWPAPVREYLGSLASFGVMPTPHTLAAAMAHHPAARAGTTQFALIRLLGRGQRRNDLVDLLLSGSDVALDAVEDVARRVIPAIDRRGGKRNRPEKSDNSGK